MRLSGVIDELVEERELDRSKLGEIISEAMYSAYAKKYPEQTFDIKYNHQKDSIEIMVQKKVVSVVKDEDVEISQRKARSLLEDPQIDDLVWVPFEDGKAIGRIEILKIKQFIATRIMQIESAIIFERFKSKEGSIVYGVVHKCEHNGAVVKIGDNLAFLPKSLSVPGAKCVVGFSLRALLKEVLPEPRNDSQLILDRSSEKFVQALFEAEIPEIFEGLVEIKKIVRLAGYKTKIAVSSNDSNIDPIGTCVGVGGARIKPILKELGGEKIDIILWSDNIETLIRSALKPAIINSVEVISDSSVNVWLDDDQRSLAIGKSGKNIALASQLSGVSINLIQPEGSSNLDMGQLE